MDHLEKLLSTRHTFKTFLPKELEANKIERILKSMNP